MQPSKHRAKKSLGQNFLKSKAALQKMVQASGAAAGGTVLEIGPGKGALTEVLLATGTKVIAIEKDDHLIPYLQELFSKEISSGQLTLIHGDATELSPEKLGLKQGTWKLVANIPYYITGLLIRRYLETECQPESLTLLVQKEVAERIVAKDGKESILSISVKLFGTPSYKGTVSKRYFSPSPKVDSAILHIAVGPRKYKPTDEKHFFEIVKQAFAHKRKTLVHNLGTTYSKELLLSALNKIQKGDRARAEELAISEWYTLYDLLH